MNDTYKEKRLFFYGESAYNYYYAKNLDNLKEKGSCHHFVTTT